MSSATTTPTRTDEERARELASRIRARLEERFAGMVRLSPRNQPIASDADPDTCARRQVLEIVAWKDKAPIPAERQGRMEAGIDAEVKGIRLLQEMGFRVVKEQTPFELKHRKTGEPCLRGKLDGFVVDDGEEVPFEGKSLVPHVYNRIDSVEDHFRYWWTRRHVTQLQAYLIGYGKPFGFFFDTDLLGNWKPIPVVLDYSLAERIWSFAEATVDAARVFRETGALPPFTLDPTECSHCPFFGRACQPPIEEQGAAMFSDPELLAEIQRWHETKAIAKEHEGLDKRIKEVIRATRVERAIAGEFAISVKERHVKGYPVAPRVDRIVTIEHLFSGEQQ